MQRNIWFQQEEAHQKSHISIKKGSIYHLERGLFCNKTSSSWATYISTFHSHGHLQVPSSHIKLYDISGRLGGFSYGPALATLDQLQIKKNIRPNLPDTSFEVQPRSMASGAGNSFSRRRWTSASSLLISVTLCFMFHCAICLLPVRFLWLFGGRRSRQMLRGRQEFRNLRRAATRGPIPSFGPSSSDELRGFSRRRKALVFGFISSFQLRMEHRSKLTNSTSSSSEGRESHQPPCAAPPHLNGARSYSITSPDPSLIGKTPISPSCKVMLYSPPGCLRDSGSFPLRPSSSGGLSVGVEEHLRSKASWLVRTTFTELMSLNDWAWPICLMKLVSLPRPSPIKENSIQIPVAFHA
ncbi:hypothetical protein YC2023_090002 [Brassica napus]